MSLVFWEMEIKELIITRVRVANINRHTLTSVGEDVGRKRNPRTLLVGWQTGAATMENSMVVSQKTENRNTKLHSSSTFGNLPEEKQNH